MNTKVKDWTVRMGDETALLDGDGAPVPNPHYDPSHGDIVAASDAQDARKYKWEGWSWKDYQSAIVRFKYRVSQLEAGRTEAAKSNKP